MSGIKVDSNEVAVQAANLKSASSVFHKKSLSSPYNAESICANSTLKTAYSNSQNTMNSFCAAMENDAKNVDQLGAKFKEFDNTMKQKNMSL